MRDSCHCAAVAARVAPGTNPVRRSSYTIVGSSHSPLPGIAPRDLVLRYTGTGWFVEDARGRPVCERLDNVAEARLIGRTFVPPRGRVWVCDVRGWSVLDED